MQAGARYTGGSNGLDEPTIGRYVSLMATGLPASSEEWLQDNRSLHEIAQQHCLEFVGGEIRKSETIPLFWFRTEKDYTR